MMSNKPDKVQESLVVRGIAATIQAMSFPTFENLAELVKKFGYNLIKENK